MYPRITQRLSQWQIDGELIERDEMDTADRERDLSRVGWRCWREGAIEARQRAVDTAVGQRVIGRAEIVDGIPLERDDRRIRGIAAGIERRCDRVVQQPQVVKLEGDAVRFRADAERTFA